MPSHDKLSNESQASELYEAIQINTSVFGENMGEFYNWHLGSVVLPDVVIARCDIESDRTDRYYGMVTAPVDTHNPDVHRGINLLWSNAPERGRPTDHIQYRVVKDSAGIFAVEKFFLAEPTKAWVLDSKLQLAELESEIAEGLVIPDIDEDFFGFYALLGKKVHQRIDELSQRREVAEHFAREIGATAVYADEADALLDLLTIKTYG